MYVCMYVLPYYAYIQYIQYVHTYIYLRVLVGWLVGVLYVCMYIHRRDIIAR